MIAFCFPGQGSQKPGMGAPFIGHPSWELVDAASDLTGRDLAALLLESDADELKQTRNAQLSTFVLSLVVLDAVERTGIEPSIMAGHSLGEYTALVAAGIISFEDGVRLVAERGEAMQQAADDRPGTMAAVLGLDDDVVASVCARLAADVWVANMNAPGQVVIAGTVEGVAAASAAAKEAGAGKVLPIPVGGAFHTPLMAPARDRLAKALATTDFRDSTCEVVANVDAVARVAHEPWRELLAAQLCSPVRWRQGLHTIEDAGATTVVELGPGTVLTGTVKKTLRNMHRASVATPDDLDVLLATMHGPAADPVDTTPNGEHLYAVERLVVSPAAGIFQPDETCEPGRPLHAGDRLGTVGDHEVRSAFTGAVAGVLAVAGERVGASQPIAWLRTS